MPQTTSSLEPVSRALPAGSDEQLWPIVCATMVLVGILAVIVCVNSDFDEQSLLLNGYTHLAALAVAAALLIFIGSRLKGAARRTAELAILLSLALHTAGGVGAFYLFQSDLGGSNLLDAVRDAQPEVDDEPPPPDYHWAQDEEQPPEQAFEQVVTTTIHEQAPPAAQVQPRDKERPAPAVEIPRAPNVEITPLGVGGVPEPSGPLDIRRPEAAKIEEAKPPEALAMVRQKGDELPLPKTDSPAPAAMPVAPPEPPKTPEAAALQAEKIDWTSLAKKAAPNNGQPGVPGAPPHKMARVEVQPSEALPSPQIIAQLPSQAPPQSSNAQSGPEAADRITQQGSTLERSNRDGPPLPSTVIPDAGLPAQSPAAPAVPCQAGWKPFPPSRWRSRIPRGPRWGPRSPRPAPRISAGVPRSCRHGGARSTVAAGASLRSKATRAEDPSELRAGAPASDLSKGLPLPWPRPGGRSHRKPKTAAPVPVPVLRPACRGPSPRWD